MKSNVKLLRSRTFKENLIYSLLWIFMFITPVVSMYVRMVETNDPFDWAEIFQVWKVYAVFLVIFLIHNFFLAPMLIEKRSIWKYFCSTLCLVILFVVFQCVSKPKLDVGPDRPQMGMSSVPPEFRGMETKPGQPGPRRPDRKPDGLRNGAKERPDSRMGPPIIFGQADVINTIIIILLLGGNLAVKLYFKSEETERDMQLLENKNLEQQLQYLKYQISPHFFMNTLNNIHALVDIDPEKAKTTILELSKLMRYVLYEGDKTTVPLQRDIDFMQHYIDLMRLRFSDKVDIQFKTDGLKSVSPNAQDSSQEDECSMPNAQCSMPNIPPMLFISLIENAFKHGISYNEPSFIHIEISTTDDNQLLFHCRNSRHKENPAEKGGVGLANVKKRLNLIYQDNYSLIIDEQPTVYDVKTQIPL